MVTPALLRALAIIAFALGAAIVFAGVALLLVLALGIIIFGLVARTGPRAAAPRYRLEHRRPGRRQMLVATDDEATGRAALQIHAMELEAAGATGQLVLVEGDTRHPVTWQVLDPRAGDPTEPTASAASTQPRES